MKGPTETVLTQLRSEIKSGQLTRLPSCRQLAAMTGLHRHTCAKILSKLREEGVIETHRGASSTIVKAAKNNPVDDAIDYLLKQGMTGAEVQEKLLKTLERRKAITIESPNMDLIKFELAGFPFSADGLTVSDQPGGEFLLQLSDISQISKEIWGQRCVGIVSKSETFRSHIKGAIVHGEVIEALPINNLVSSVFHFSTQVVCDYVIACRLKQAAVRHWEATGKRITITPVPYLNPKTIEDLRSKLIDV